jgi:RDD family
MSRKPAPRRWIRKRSRDLTPASKGRRLAASLIDAPFALGAVGAVVAGAAWSSKRASGDPSPRARGERLTSKRFRLSMSLCVASLSVLRNLHRSPGQRLAGIRVVGARSGGPITFWQAVILATAPALKQQLLRMLTSPLEPPEQPVKDHGPALEQLRRLHGDDQEALSEATMAYYRDQRGEWAWSTLLAQPLATATLSLLIEALVRRRWQGRSMEEVLAGTAVVMDR